MSLEARPETKKLSGGSGDLARNGYRSDSALEGGPSKNRLLLGITAVVMQSTGHQTQTPTTMDPKP